MPELRATPKISPKDEPAVIELAEEAKRTVDAYYGQWSRPMRYVLIMPRLIKQLPPGVKKTAFIQFLQERRYVHFTMAPSAKQYVFPDLELVDLEDTAVQKVLEEEDANAREEREKSKIVRTEKRAQKRQRDEKERLGESI